MDRKSFDKVLLVSNRIDELSRVQVFIEELGGEWQMPASIIMSLNLVLEEALTNTILYGYDDDNKHTIEVTFSLKGDNLIISLVDDGHPYDPTLKEDPDITLPPEERNIGGLGIFLIKQIMDTVEYRKTGNNNCLILAKNIRS